MTLRDGLDLLPLILLSAVLVISMLGIAFGLKHRPVFWLTLAGFVLSLVAVPLVSASSPRQVTSLFIVDNFASFYTALILAGGLVTTCLSRTYIEKMAENKGEYYMLITAATLGAVMLVISAHFVSFFLGTGIVSLSLYTLIAYSPLQRQRIEAGIKYLILVGAASAILLFGMALIYAAVGSMQFDRISLVAIQAARDDPFLLIGFGLLIAGISFELALVPFHMWTPDVYQGAPAPVTGYIATVAKAGMFALMIRLFFHTSLNIGSPLWVEFSAIAIASMLVGNLLAVVQKSVKRILAYSSIAHVGYLMVPFLAGGAPLSQSAMGFYWVVYFITTLLAFGIVSSFSNPADELDDLESWRGFFRRQPWPAVMFFVALLSLTGLPPTGGLVGKIYLIAAGVQSSLWLLLAALVIGSIIGLFYYMRIAMLFFRQPKDEPASYGSMEKDANLVLSILAGLLVILGLFPTPLIALINQLVSTIG
jgi:NADH-quinone oxidoreductase subunit N